MLSTPHTLLNNQIENFYCKYAQFQFNINFFLILLGKFTILCIKKVNNSLCYIISKNIWTYIDSFFIPIIYFSESTLQANVYTPNNFIYLINIYISVCAIWSCRSGNTFTIHYFSRHMPFTFMHALIIHYHCPIGKF